MKNNNKVLIIVGVILLNILVLFTIGKSLSSKTSELQRTKDEAEKYVKQELCSKALEKYEEALAMEDELSTRIDMLAVYEKGIEIGEITSTYEAFGFAETMVDTYYKDPLAYEVACDMFMRYGKYEDCAKYLMQARDLEVTSKKITELRNEVRYMYNKDYSMYESVLPSSDGYYTVVADGTYSFLDDTGSPYSYGTYTHASSFSFGYAFVKAMHPDGTEKKFIINEEEKRQIYLDDVESSSGVGDAKSKDNDELLLLSCKVGKKYKYYDLNGKQVLKEYAFAGRFRNNIAAVMESEGKWKLINGDGETIVDKTFTDVVLNEFDECAPKGLIIANDGKGYHIYNYEGKQVGNFTCDEAKAFVNGYAAFRKGEKWGYVDENGKVVIEPQYDDAKSFSYSLGSVKQGDMWYLISPNNKFITEEAFEDVDYLNNKGICFVKIDGYWSSLEFYYTGN